MKFKIDEIAKKRILISILLFLGAGSGLGVYFYKIHHTNNINEVAEKKDIKPKPIYENENDKNNNIEEKKDQVNDQKTAEKNDKKVNDEIIIKNAVEEVSGLTYNEAQKDTLKHEDGTFSLYVYTYDNKLCYNDRSTSCNVPKYRIKITTNKAQIISYDEYDNFILIKDGSLKIVDLKNKTITKTPLSQTNQNGENFDLFTNKYADGNYILYGITHHLSQNHYELYNYKTNQILYRNMYEHINIIDNQFAEARKNNKVYLVSMLNEKEYFSIDKVIIDNQEYESSITTHTFNNKSIAVSIQEKIEATGDIYTNALSVQDYYKINLYSLNGILLKEDVGAISVHNDKVYTIKGNQNTIYDLEGKVIKTQEIKAINNINIEEDDGFLIHNYFVYLSNQNKIISINLDTGIEETIYEFKQQIYLNIVSRSSHYENITSLDGFYIKIQYNLDDFGEIYYNPLTKQKTLTNY